MIRSNIILVALNVLALIAYINYILFLCKRTKIDIARERQ